MLHSLFRFFHAFYLQTLSSLRDAGDSLNDCRIMFVTEIYKIEEPGSSEGPGASSDSPLKSEFASILDYI